MNKMGQKGFFDLSVEKSFSEEFRLDNLKANLARGKLLAAVTLVVEIAIIITSIIFRKGASSETDKYYYAMYLLFIVTVSFFLLALSKMKANPKLGPASRAVTYGFIFFVLAWNMGISVLDGQITSYIVALLAISIIAIMRPVPMLVLYIIVQVAYCVLLLLFQESINVIYASFINSTIAAVISWTAAYILFKNRAENFTGQKELLVKRKQLEKVIAELNIANKKLEYLSQTDGLTGIHNRRMFDKVSNDFWKDCLKEKNTLAVIMIDIDHFKIFNDTYGHQQGDDCLKDIVSNIKSIVPQESMLARYGGEEFAVLLKDCEKNDSFKLAEKIREATASLNIKHENSPVKPYVTLSLGVYCGTPVIGDSVIGFIAMADKSLFKAKNSGRDRTLKSD